MRRTWPMALLSLVVNALSIPALAEGESFVVTAREVADPKAVFATVESANVVPARARIGGTVASLLVDEGATVTAGETIAAVGDEKLALQIKSIDAQIAGLQAQFDKAKTDLGRAQDLFERGTIPRARLDDATTAFDVASNALESQRAQRRVVTQQQAEGEVLAPTTGRVLTVPVTQGSVILPGEPIAMIAEANYVLRLRLPERHARYLSVGDEIRLATSADADAPAAATGRIVTVYPEITDGRVIADAAIEGLGDYFVGERVRVWVSTGTRTAYVVPAAYLTTRFGVDFALIESEDNAPMEVPVQRGQTMPLPDLPDGVEILSGLRAGDRLVAP
jgi:RND family efflux transporter MFP subunit